MANEKLPLRTRGSDLPGITRASTFLRPGPRRSRDRSFPLDTWHAVASARVHNQRSSLFLPPFSGSFLNQQRTSRFIVFGPILRFYFIFYIFFFAATLCTQDGGKRVYARSRRGSHTAGGAKCSKSCWFLTIGKTVSVQFGTWDSLFSLVLAFRLVRGFPRSRRVRRCLTFRPEEKPSRLCALPFAPIETDRERSRPIDRLCDAGEETGQASPIDRGEKEN